LQWPSRGVSAPAASSRSRRGSGTRLPAASIGQLTMKRLPTAGAMLPFSGSLVVPGGGVPERGTHVDLTPHNTRHSVTMYWTNGARRRIAAKLGGTSQPGKPAARPEAERYMESLWRDLRYALRSIGSSATSTPSRSRLRGLSGSERGLHGTRLLLVPRAHERLAAERGGALPVQEVRRRSPRPPVLRRRTAAPRDEPRARRRQPEDHRGPTRARVPRGERGPDRVALTPHRGDDFSGDPSGLADRRRHADGWVWCC